VAISPDIVGGHHVELAADWGSKLGSFWGRHLFLAANLWDVSPSPAVKRVWVAFLAAGVAAALVRGGLTAGVRGLADTGLRSVLALLCMPLAVAPLLAAAYGGVSYRSLAALSAMTVLLSWWAAG